MQPPDLRLARSLLAAAAAPGAAPDSGLDRRVARLERLPPALARRSREARIAGGAGRAPSGAPSRGERDRARCERLRRGQGRLPWRPVRQTQHDRLSPPRRLDRGWLPASVAGAPLA